LAATQSRDFTIGKTTGIPALETLTNTLLFQQKLIILTTKHEKFLWENSVISEKISKTPKFRNCNIGSELQSLMVWFQNLVTVQTSSATPDPVGLITSSNHIGPHRGRSGRIRVS